MNGSVESDGNDFVDLAEDARIHFLISEILENLSARMKILSGKERLAIQEEFLEWIGLMNGEDEKVEITFMDFYAN